MASCGKGATDPPAAIENTIKGYVRTFNASDFAQCMTYFTDYDNEADALAFLSYMRSLSGPLKLREIKDIDMVLVAVPGGSRTATANVIFALGGEESTDQMRLKEVDGKWKIIWQQETGETAAKGTATIEGADDIAAIEETIRGYFAAYNAEDFARCLTYLTNFSDEENEKSSLFIERNFWGKAILQEVEEIKTTGATVAAKYTVIIEGSSNTNKVQLQKIDGQWKIILDYAALFPNLNFIPNPAQGFLPGSVEFAPEFQGTMQAEHRLWVGEDGQLRAYYNVRNIGDQPTAHLFAVLEIYNSTGELLMYHNPSGILEMGEGMGVRDLRGQDDIVTLSAAYYKVKVVVKSE